MITRHVPINVIHTGSFIVEVETGLKLSTGGVQTNSLPVSPIQHRILHRKTSLKTLSLCAICQNLGHSYSKRYISPPSHRAFIWYNFIMLSGSGSCGVGLVCQIKGIKSRDIVSWGITAVKNLTHRGAVGADGKTGDGSGILTQIPKKFFLKELKERGFRLSDTENLAIGFFFLNAEIESGIQDIVIRYGFRPIGWRDVPINDDAIGQTALATRPVIKQLLIDAEGVEFKKREIGLFLARRVMEKRYGEKVYIPSLSSKTIAYKGMLVAPQLDRFYPDLTREDFESAFCLFHQRFSTNTSPDWGMAQPFRTIAHNGEINTVKGNRNWMTHVEHELRHEVFADEKDSILPLISHKESDSASLDRIIELLMLCGYSPEHAINMCVPPAWENSGMNDDEKAFFEYQSLLMKPWDGPAAIVITNGETIGAHLDRNGLRPLRYMIMEDNLLIIGSETGIVDFGGRAIWEKGRLGPGDTLSVNLLTGHLHYTENVIRQLSEGKHYKNWIDEHLYRVKENATLTSRSLPEVTRKQIAFGYTSEEIQNSIKNMALNAKEMTYSMGDDTPIPPLAEKPQLLFRYFKQRFSQVTNPPIDPIRERTVMSIKMALGYKRNFLFETPEHASRLKIDSPVLLEPHLRDIEKQGVLKTGRVMITYAKTGSRDTAEIMPEENILTGCLPGEENLLLSAVRKLQKKVVELVRNGVEILILSDTDLARERVAIPSLLAVSASFKALERQRLANKASLIVESAEPRDIHHIACLIGYGASAVFPYLALETIKELCDKEDLNISYEQAAANYKKALEDGLLNVIARMGISTLNSYQAAQLFDTVCLNGDFVEEFFEGTPVTIESDGLHEVEASFLKRHAVGFETPEPVLDFGGNLKPRKGGEWHQWSTSSVIALNKFIKTDDDASKDLFAQFLQTAGERPIYIRHLLTYRTGESISVEEVESEECILKRFFSGAMSVGALSPKAHETIAEACNTLCIRSNSGEGGEDPARYWTIKNSAIKQIASGRFGVTPAYLASASELEIKIAQGAKPGEGGHLPANKVTEYIATLRHCSPNIHLISPPPHHDVYSIEDLAQLINDLKEVNPKAKVCVKLVSETGVGTVAAGVAKAYADIIQISGCEGGTGASPVGSIKNAGNYWEIGLAETQKTLLENGLRERVTVRVDGGLRTGKDVIIAALLGAEEFGFGTATMIAAGCIMARQCHLNTCPTGIATQNERLIKNFKGTVEGVIAYFSALARNVRTILAEMGCRGLNEIIGRTDLLVFAPWRGYPASARINLESLLTGCLVKGMRVSTSARNDNPAPSINDRILDDLLPFIEKAKPVTREYKIRNVNRSVPLKLNYHISLRYKDEGLPPDTINLTFRGTAGQSFGAFNHRGISLRLIGDANDYVGKGMYGGKIIILPDGIRDPHNHVILGNTVLYGATGGKLYAAGKAGERFGVRNSGASAVIEGTGHHLCEYMTRGTVVVLGEVGHNVGAGMTGGVIYIFDENDRLNRLINRSYTRIVEPEQDDRERLKTMLRDHHRYTESIRAEEILQNFDKSMSNFRKVLPL
jgi:glutamate synthase (NADPH) large chain